MLVSNPSVGSELYNLDTTPYESVLIGLYSIWRGEPANGYKYNSVQVGYSRDGVSFYRPVRTFLYSYSNVANKWNYRNVQSAGGGIAIVGSKLYFYASGESGSVPNQRFAGLYTLRRDGFCSLGTNGYLVTRPFTLTKPYLFVILNAATNGYLQVDVLNQAGEPLDPSLQRQYSYVGGNSTTAIVLWKDRTNLISYLDQVVKFRFTLTNAELYSFWLSDLATGPSYGYTSSGGPGLNDAVDATGADINPQLTVTNVGP